MSSIIEAKAIATDASIPRRGPAIRTKHYPRMDRVVHRRPGFAFAVSLCSARTFSYESINGENLRGWFTGSGMHYLYNDDLGHYDDDYWATVDCHRLPGTTVPVGERADGSGSNYLGSERWVGGVALDTLGVTGLHYRTFGGGPSGKTSWFMFGDEIAVLGTDISSSDARPVESVVENRKLDAARAQNLLVDGRRQPNAPGWTRIFDGVSWAHLDGTVAGSGVGYVFPEPTTIAATRQLRVGSWADINHDPAVPGDPLIEREYVTLWIEHGTNPTTPAYAYLLLPGASAAAVRAYARHPTTQVVANRADVQAVRSGGVLGATFWRAGAGTVSGLGCDQPAAVIVRQTGHELTMAAADPTHQDHEPAHVTIRQCATTELAQDPRITVEQLSPSIRLAIDLTDTNGQPAAASFHLR